MDFLLSGAGRPDCYLEVKNAHLRRSGDSAEFPDTVTRRGAKHLGELAAMARAGSRAAVLYVVQRDGRDAVFYDGTCALCHGGMRFLLAEDPDCARFRLAGDIDPDYAQAAAQAQAAGVEMLCHGTTLSPQAIRLAGPIPLELTP